MTTIIEQFDSKIAELAWSLWNELGVAGVNRNHKSCLINLEELIILTAVIAEYDPRLRDEALDWCSRYHHFVSISRLRTLVKIFGKSVYLPFSAFAITLNSNAQSKWPIFSHTSPLKFSPSGKSSLSSFDSPSLLGMRLRALFGVGARADLFTFILTQNETVFSAADVVEVGYSKRSLADLLDHLVKAGILSTFVVRNQRKYEFVMKEQFKTISGELPKVAPPWSRILEVIFSLRNVLQEVDTNSFSTKLVVMRNTVTCLEKILPSIFLSTPPVQADPNQYWNNFTKWVFELLNAFAQGNFRGNFEVSDTFERIIISLMQELYNLDDCLDGIEHVISHAKEDPVKHKTVYKENYQLCISFCNDLKGALTRFLRFPFHRLMDVKLSDIPYQFAKNHLNQLLLAIDGMSSLDLITGPHYALRQYEILVLELNRLHEFLNEFRDQLKKIYFLRKNINLLTLPSKLYKRRSVLKLFSS